MHVQIAAKKVRPSTSGLITGRSQVPAIVAPLSLTTQVPDQWIFTGGTPEVPAQKVSGGTTVINPLVLGLTFLAAI